MELAGRCSRPSQDRMILFLLKRHRARAATCAQQTPELPSCWRWQLGDHILCNAERAGMMICAADKDTSNCVLAMIAAGVSRLARQWLCALLKAVLCVWLPGEMQDRQGTVLAWPGHLGQEEMSGKHGALCCMHARAGQGPPACTACGSSVQARMGSCPDGWLTISSSMRPTLVTLVRHTMSLPTTMLVVKPRTASARGTLMRPPGGEKAQHLTPAPWLAACTPVPLMGLVSGRIQSHRSLSRVCCQTVPHLRISSCAGQCSHALSCLWGRHRITRAGPDRPSE